jgi:hypothetical protein
MGRRRGLRNRGLCSRKSVQSLRHQRGAYMQVLQLLCGLCLFDLDAGSMLHYCASNSHGASMWKDGDAAFHDLSALRDLPHQVKCIPLASARSNCLVKASATSFRMLVWSGLNGDENAHELHTKGARQTHEQQVR